MTDKEKERREGGPFFWAAVTEMNEGIGSKDVQD